MDNIKESKEYQLAKDWERAVNDYGFLLFGHSVHSEREV